MLRRRRPSEHYRSPRRLSRSHGLSDCRATWSQELGIFARPTSGYPLRLRVDAGNHPRRPRPAVSPVAETGVRFVCGFPDVARADQYIHGRAARHPHDMSRGAAKLSCPKPAARCPCAAAALGAVDTSRVAREGSDANASLRQRVAPDAVPASATRRRLRRAAKQRRVCLCSPFDAQQCLQGRQGSK